MNRLLFILSFTSVLSWADNNSDQCKHLTQQGDQFFENNEIDKGMQAWKSAVSFCEKSNAGDYSLFINLGQKYFAMQKYADAVPLFKKALVVAPGSQIAYLNICAAEMQQDSFDAAIAACKSGIESKALLSDALRRDWIPKLNFNMGFAMFKKAVATNNFTNSSSLAYFKKAAELDPSMGQAYYYWGMVTQNMMNNPSEAKGIYQKGCFAKDEDSCKQFHLLANAPAQPKSVPPVTSVNAASTAQVPFTPQELSNLQKIEKAYLKKGLPAEQAKNASDQIKNSLRELTPAQRAPSFDSILKSLQ